MLYSSIFNTYYTQDNVPFYNILKKIQLPEDKTSELYTTYIVPYSMPWTTLSYLIYGDLTYYWLILLANTNKKLNPMYASVSDKIFIVKPEYLSMVVETIENEI